MDSQKIKQRIGSVQPLYAYEMENPVPPGTNSFFSAMEGKRLIAIKIFPSIPSFLGVTHAEVKSCLKSGFPCLFSGIKKF